MEKMVGVIGAHECAPDLYELAYEVGYGVAQHGLTLVCGGLGGVMTAACQGAKAAGGRTVGILPNAQADTANAWVDVAIATGMGEARNGIIVHSAQVLIAIAGGYGTLAEIALALRAQKPIVGLHSWTFTAPGEVQVAMPTVATAAEAVAWAITQLQ